MSAPFANLYTHRKVAEASSRACDICYKHTTSVLITSDKKDFFYVCPIHLKDRNFCTPKTDEAQAAAKKREKELEAEKERVKKEYEEKMRRKKEKEDKEKDDKDKDKNKKDKEDDKKEEKKINDDGKNDEDKKDEPEEEPRVFELKPNFFTARLQSKRRAEAAKRDRERISQPGYFPSVPTGDPSK